MAAALSGVIRRRPAAPRALCAALCVALLLCAGCERLGAESSDIAAAEEAARAQDWAQAARLLQRALREEADPEKRWMAWTLLVNASQRLGENAWEVDYLQAMLLEYGRDENRVVYVLRRLGDACRRAGQWDEAVAAWLRLLDEAELAPDEAAALCRRIGQYRLRDLDFEQAAGMFTRCAGTASSADLRDECRLALADIHGLEKRYAEAEAELDRIIQTPDASPSIKGRAYFLLGDVCEQQARAPEARLAFRAALPLHPNPPVVSMRLEYLTKK